MNDYRQLAVWHGTILGDDQVDDFKEFMLEHTQTRVEFAEMVYTLPDMVNGETVPDTGDRGDLFFYVHNEDIPQFSIQRFKIDSSPPRWWEDVLDNGGGTIYPQDVLEKYPKTW